MKQEARETTDAIMEDDNKLIHDIVSANKARTKPYWIVLFAKPSKVSVDGKYTLVKHIQAYANKPKSQVGMVCGEVNNKTGEISWEVNMPQIPFDYDGLIALGAEVKPSIVTETTTIPDAYVTR